MEQKTKQLIKDIVNRRIQGVYLDGTLCPIKYSVSANTFYVTFSGKIKAYRRNTLVALLLDEVSRMERYSKLVAEESK